MNINYHYKSSLMGATIYPFFEKGYVFFWGGIFSQWAEGEFYVPFLNQRVNCAEQAMMLAKAKIFKDDETFDKISREILPRNQKQLGREVKNFDPVVWDKMKFSLVKNINYCKYTHPAHMQWKELLFLTHPYTLVEASPNDKIWGIGMDKQNPDLLKTEIWGQNLLGKAITAIRDQLLQE